MRRKFDSDILSLMHFDYPYYGEPGDGMRDEIGKLVWTKNGDVSFVGVGQPVSEVVTGTPKFGWRCLQTTKVTDYLFAPESTGALNINKTGRMEIEAFVRRTGSTEGNVMTLFKSGSRVFSVGFDASGIVVVTGEGISVTSGSGPAISTWDHLCVRISENACHVYLNGTDVGDASITPGIIEVDEIRLGGFPGQMDEFRLRRKAGSGLPAVPEHPYRGLIPLKSLGGFGNGSQGDVAISEANVDINTTAIVQSGSPQMLTIGAQSEGRYGAIVPGDKVMVHVSLGRNAVSVSELGKFSVRNVTTFVGDKLTLDSPIDELAMDPEHYYIQVIKIPQFNTLNVLEGGSIVPKAWNTTTGGGMVALVCKGNCRVSGNITTVGKGATRVDNLPFCHAMMQERFLLTGNVFLLCGGALIATGRIGATWSGAGGGGVASGRNNYAHGTIGVGGGGAGAYNTGDGGSGHGKGGDGDGGSGNGYGGGGGGGAGGRGGNCGEYLGGVGGQGYGGGQGGGPHGGNGGGGYGGGGGATGYYDNYNKRTALGNGGGGGGSAGYSGGDGLVDAYSDPDLVHNSGGQPGASLIILALILSVNTSSISSGGSGGELVFSSGGGGAGYGGAGAGGGSSRDSFGGGGGTGFCYLAYKEVI